MSNRDYFSLYLDTLSDRHEDVRRFGTKHLATYVSVWIPSGQYVHVCDAYIDANRSDEMLSALRDAVGREAPGSRERRAYLGIYVAAKARAYLWAHPETARILRVHLSEAPPKYYGGFCPWTERFKPYAALLIAEGDEDFRKAWEEYNSRWE
ncbi:MAG TPA: hypothetical protein VNA25_25710 [Phycisphaerae bacterium]|nr:hypothetical protein [Phycisphaerae bacterium]